MARKIFWRICAAAFVSAALSLPALAHMEQIDLHALGRVAIPLHIAELVLSLFTCFMSIRFFRITRPISLFLFTYVAIGFFMINSLLNLLFFVFSHQTNTTFVNVHIGSRIALIGMAFSFVMFFYSWNKAMRKSNANK